MFQIKSGEKTFEVENREESNAGTLNGQDYRLDLYREGDSLHILKDKKSYRVHLVSANWEEKTFELMVNGHTYHLQALDQYDLLLAELGMENMAGGNINDLKAPMPGMVLQIEVEAGQEVKKGDPLIVLEAMKMENILKAAHDARIKAIHAEQGKPVEKNQVLIEFG